MGDGSNIEWTDATWNPVTGCTKLSPGCKNCYAERMAVRLEAMGLASYRNGFQVTCHPHLLDKPMRWRTPRRIFVNSMSDLFHDSVPDQFIDSVFGTMLRCPQHEFQVLTKRPERALALAPVLPWPDNVWLGTSVESAKYLHRIDALRETPARLRFLSLEPLLGPLGDIDLRGIGWVIVGGESGPGSRPMVSDWVGQIADQCQRAGVPFFFKQWGGTNKKLAGRSFRGRTWDDFPQSPGRPPLRPSAESQSCQNTSAPFGT